MTWSFITDNWSDITDLFSEYFPNAAAVTCPHGVADLTTLIATLAREHELTVGETAELLDDLVMTAWANSRYVSDVTHKMVASS